MYVYSPDHGLRPELAKQYVEARGEFDSAAREHTRKHAM